MFCGKCGAENADNAMFCESCGNKLDSVVEKGKESIPEKEHTNRDSSAKKIGIIVGVVLIVAVAVIAVIFGGGKKKEKEYATHIESAEKYIEELDYESAEAAYLAAIAIDPKREEPYLRLIQIYTEQNKPEKVIELLEKANEAEIESELIQEKYALYTYVEKVLIPEYGQVEAGVYEATYRPAEGGYAFNNEPIHTQSGVVTSRIMDFDNDGEEELLVALFRNDVAHEYWGGTYNAIDIQMYEYVDGAVSLVAQMEAVSAVLGGLDEESTGIFLQEHEGVIYICGGSYQLAYLFADGSSFTSFVVTYENNEFVDYTGQRDGVMGSSFEYYEYDAQEMATKLENIGLTNAAQDVRDSWMMRMTYKDDVSDMLFRTEGHNVGRKEGYWESKNVEDVGVLKLHLWIGENSSDGMNASELDIFVLKTEIDEIESYVELYSEWADSTSDMLELMAEGRDKCNEVMKRVVTLLQKSMDDEAWKSFKEEHLQWKEDKKLEMEAASDEFEGGTYAKVAYVATAYELTKERTLELLDKLETLIEENGEN